MTDWTALHPAIFWIWLAVTGLLALEVGLNIADAIRHLRRRR